MELGNMFSGPLGPTHIDVEVGPVEGRRRMSSSYCAPEDSDEDVAQRVMELKQRVEDLRQRIVFNLREDDNEPAEHPRAYDGQGNGGFEQGGCVTYMDGYDEGKYDDEYSFTDDDCDVMSYTDEEYDDYDIMSPTYPFPAEYESEVSERDDSLVVEVDLIPTSEVCPPRRR
jgi:hypothetical protein